MSDIQVQTVSTSSFSMDYIRFGSGGQTLVILPGLSVQSVLNFANDIASAYSPLAKDFTVWLFDRRKELPPAYSVYDMARDTAEVLQVLGLDDICLFGASQGGMIAMEMAVEHPGLVRRMVIASTSSNVDEERFREIGEWAEYARNGKREELYLAFGKACYPKDMFESTRELLVAAAKTVTDDELERFVIIAEGMRGFCITDRLDRLTCPVLYIGSEDKVFGSEAAAELINSMKGRQNFDMFMYKGCGHAVYDTAPDFKERLLRFFVS